VLVGRRYLRVEDGNERLTALIDPVEYQQTVDYILRSVLSTCEQKEGT
jgi:hypothetical protein